VLTLAGDIHHAYAARIAYPAEDRVQSAVWQAVCSPFRNALSRKEERVAKLGDSPVPRAIAAVLARLAGRPPPSVRWELAQDPTFDNQFATLDFDGASARLRIEMIVPGDWRHPEIRTTLDRQLTESA
jgi:hypothetical protein